MDTMHLSLIIRAAGEELGKASEILRSLVSREEFTLAHLNFRWNPTERKVEALLGSDHVAGSPPLFHTCFGKEVSPDTVHAIQEKLNGEGIEYALIDETKRLPGQSYHAALLEGAESASLIHEGEQAVQGQGDFRGRTRAARRPGDTTPPRS